jgi:hypothetical protein
VKRDVQSIGFGGSCQFIYQSGFGALISNGHYGTVVVSDKLLESGCIPISIPNSEVWAGTYCRFGLIVTIQDRKKNALKANS